MSDHRKYTQCFYCKKLNGEHADDCEKMTKTPEEKAVALAEWLGCGWEDYLLEGAACDWKYPAADSFVIYGPPDGKWMNKEIFYKSKVEWLADPKGEVAMMDKLEELRIRCEWWVGAQDEKNIYYTIASSPFDKKDLYINKYAPTRNAALQAAILQMLEGE